MATPRAKTLQERFGFLDEDLKTPAHDALMLWIDEYIPEILAEVFSLTEAPVILSKRWEHVIMTERDFILGAADMFVRAACGHTELVVYIEAKSKIDSLGTLLRQIRFYQAGGVFDHQSRMGDSIRPKWLVIAPDDRFAAKIREQGIHFHKSPTV